MGKRKPDRGGGKYPPPGGGVPPKNPPPGGSGRPPAAPQGQHFSDWQTVGKAGGRRERGGKAQAAGSTALPQKRPMAWGKTGQAGSSTKGLVTLNIQQDVVAKLESDGATPAHWSEGLLGGAPLLAIEPSLTTELVVKLRDAARMLIDAGKVKKPPQVPLVVDAVATASQAGGFGVIARQLAVMELYRYDTKRSVSVLKCINLYKNVDTFQSDLQEALQSSGEEATPSDGDLVTFLYKKEGVLRALRNRAQERLRKVTKFPEEVKVLFRGMDELNGLVKDYVGCEDEYIAQLQHLLRDAQQRKADRVRDCQGVKSSLSDFGRLRTGTLTDQERTDAIDKFNGSEILQQKFTLDNFLEASRFIKQKKVFSGATLQSFQQMCSAERLAEHRSRVQIDVDAAAQRLSRLHAVDGQSLAPDQAPQLGDEEMGQADVQIAEDLDLSDYDM